MKNKIYKKIVFNHVLYSYILYIILNTYKQFKL